MSDAGSSPNITRELEGIVTGEDNPMGSPFRPISRNSANSANREEGNSGSSSLTNPHRYAFLTLNNYTCAEHVQLTNKLNILAEKWILGKEVGESGTPHLQGAVHFKIKCRPRTRVGMPRIHWEVMKGTWAEATVYCAKEGDYTTKGVAIQEPLRLITPGGTGDPPDPDFVWQIEIMNLIAGRPDDRKIYWYVDQEGGKGKSALTKLLCAKYAAICMAGKAADMKMGMMTIKEKQGAGPRIVILDCPRTQDLKYISFQGIEEIKNGCFYSSKYEGGMYLDNPPHVLIFSNHFPDETQLTADRWVITQI